MAYHCGDLTSLSTLTFTSTRRFPHYVGRPSLPTHSTTNYRSILMRLAFLQGSKTHVLFTFRLRIE
jgi:hypothetical protein